MEKQTQLPVDQMTAQLITRMINNNTYYKLFFHPKD